MGNSCTREDAITLSETGMRPQFGRGEAGMRQRGRWSEMGFEGSVDLDALLEAPSPVAAARRRKRGKSKSEQIHRTLSRGSSNASNTLSASNRPVSADGKKKKKKSRWFRSAKSASAADEQQREEEEESTYHSYDDPGYLSAENELATLDSDLILASPPESPTVIHARWGEPVDDPDEESVCTDFKPNPFKLGFCINCQKQHDVNENGVVESTKEYKKIARPTISKTAANALDNPAAVLNATPRSRGSSDVDLAELLQQRREILAKLGRMGNDKSDQPEFDGEVDVDVDFDKQRGLAARHTMFLTDTSGTNLVNLRRMASAGRASQQAPQSLRAQRAASARTDRAPASFSGVTTKKSLSLGNAKLPRSDDEPICNDWL